MRRRPLRHVATAAKSGIAAGDRAWLATSAIAEDQVRFRVVCRGREYTGFLIPAAVIRRGYRPGRRFLQQFEVPAAKILAVREQLGVTVILRTARQAR